MFPCTTSSWIPIEHTIVQAESVILSIIYYEIYFSIY